MASVAELLWREIQDIKSKMVTAQQVQVINTDPGEGGLLVAGSDGDVPVSALGTYDPAAGDTAWMLGTGVGPVLVGATRSGLPPSPNGTIVTAPAAGAETVAVTVDGEVESLRWLASYAPVAGHTVRIHWQPVAGGGWSGCVLGQMGGVPAPKPPPAREIVETSGQAGATRGKFTLRATEVGTWRANGWRSDTTKLVMSTWTSQPPSTAVWYYGPPPAAARGAEVVSARLWIQNLTGGPFAATPIPLYLHSHQRKHNSLPPRAGSPFMSPSFRDNEGRWLTGAAINAAAQEILDGSRAGLMAVSTNRQEYTTMAGLSGAGRDPMTGAWEIEWQRT